MNNSFNSTSVIFDSSCSLKELVFIINVYIVPIISGIGVFLNLFSALVFYQILKNNSFGNMFYYLFFKCIDDAVQFIIQVFAPFYYCYNCHNSHSYMVIVWYIWFFYYAELICELGSAYMEILATFDCYITINGYLKCCKSKYLAHTLILMVHLFASIYYIYAIYSFEVVPVQSVNEQKNYDFGYTQFYYTDFAHTLRIMHTMLRDVSAFILLIILNFLILITFKKSMERKKKILRQNQKHNGSKNFTCIEKADRNNTRLIFFSGINYMMGHIGPILVYMPFDESTDFWSCFFDIHLLPFYLSYFFTFFLYFSFNKQFRHKVKINIDRFFAVFRIKCFIDLSSENTNLEKSLTNQINQTI